LADILERYDVTSLEEITFESKVAAWLTGRRPSEDALGELSQRQFETLVEKYIDDEDVSQYVIETRNQLGSQQA